jgi:hypothetical protein
MTAIIRGIAQEILDLQDGGVDAIEDVEAAVPLVLRGVYAAGYVIAREYQQVRTQSEIDIEELEV